MLKFNLSVLAFKETINSLWLNPQGEIRHLNTVNAWIYRLSAEFLSAHSTQHKHELPEEPLTSHPLPFPKHSTAFSFCPACLHGSSPNNTASCQHCSTNSNVRKEKKEIKKIDIIGIGCDVISEMRYREIYWPS